MTDIEKFIEETYENCFGYGGGCGSGDSGGYGGGYNNGYGDIYGFGWGCGDGCGSQDNYGFGFGCGTGCGRGNKYEYGYGYSDSVDIKSFNSFSVYLIDNVLTRIISAKGNVAKGFILRRDLTTKPCYIVKDNNGIYAHGNTLKEAEEALKAKYLKRMPIEERIQLFKEHFESDKLYKGQEFYDWHHTLTGSCKMGRDSFCEEHGINLESEYTVKDFIELTENSYGGEVIKKLRGIYEKDTDGR